MILSTLKLFKFRPLTSDLELERAKYILDSGQFWCSTFDTLNDPMEGVFSGSVTGVSNLYSRKAQYKICSFSGKAAFARPVVWAHYAGGFRGLAIELLVDLSEVRSITYVNDVPIVDELETAGRIERILSTKLAPWKDEDEYRYIVEDEAGYEAIGQITALYFGDPYGALDNSDEILLSSQHLRDYRRRRAELIQVASDLPCFSVTIKRCKVVKNGPLA